MMDICVQACLPMTETSQRRAPIPRSAPAEIASIIDTPLLILQDKMISEVPTELIRNRQYNAEWALRTQGDQLVSVFEQMEDPYLRHRKGSGLPRGDRGV